MHVKDKLKFIGRTAINNSVIYQVCYVKRLGESQRATWDARKRGAKIQRPKIVWGLEESAGSVESWSQWRSYGKTFFVPLFLCVFA